MSKTHAPRTASRPDAASSRFGSLGLSPAILAAVHDLGYEEPSPVQEAAIPEVLAGHDVMAAAQTGTGKTAAFLLPTMQKLAHAPKGMGPYMLVLTPTRELAQQIQETADQIARRTHSTCCSVVGGLSYDPQRRALAAGVDLLIATPGRLIDLIRQGACHLDQVKTLVLDEADRMLDMGFLPDVREIVSGMPEQRQTLLFSATLDESILEHTRSLVHDPVSISIAPKGTVAQTVEQYALPVSHETKQQVLIDILKRKGPDRVIVFCNGKHRADSLCKKLRRAGITCLPIHGDRSQNQRQKALSQFADGKIQVLVATDVLARGIDVSEVSYVINFDVPHDDVESYIHRIGRTGRAGERGWALSLVEPDDYLYLRDAEKLMDQLVPEYTDVEGLDLGKDRPLFDPERCPQDKLPSKKVRRRVEKRHIAERRATARRLAEEAAAAASAAEETEDETLADPRPAKPKKDAKRAEAPKKRSRTDKRETPKKRARKDSEAPVRKDKKDRKRRDEAPAAPARSRKDRRRTEDAEPELRDGSPKSFGMKKTKKRMMDPGIMKKAPKKKHSRHPGDHGGKRTKDRRR